jgi:probable addiction module antidote protein
MPVEFEPFDISEHLDSEEMIAGYLSAAAEDEDPNVLLGALAHAAKARGMMQVAKDAGLSRESLYKALKPGAHPRFETVQAVLRALGVKLAVAARNEATESVSAASASAATIAPKRRVPPSGSVVVADPNARSGYFARIESGVEGGLIVKEESIEAEPEKERGMDHTEKAETRPKGRPRGGRSPHRAG